MDIRITDHGIGIVPDDMSKKILIIEDDRALRETTAAFLEEEGFRVQQPPAGVQGLKAAEKDKPTSPADR